MSKQKFMLLATAATAFATVPVGTHVGTMTEIEIVHTDPVKTKSGWADATQQVRHRLKCDDGFIDYYGNTQGFVRTDDTEIIDLLLKNMSTEKIREAGLTATAYKAMSREKKYDAMFDEVPSDRYNGEKGNYLVYKHGRTRILHDERTAQAMEILGRIPVMCGIADEGDDVNLFDCIGAQIGFEVIEGPNGKNKVKSLMNVEQASA
jgi:hypothetical protein